MCIGGGGGGDGGAAAARADAENAERKAEAKEAERIAAISDEHRAIDLSFLNFDENYYGGLSDDYRQFYFPDLDRQFEDSNREQLLALSDQGILESSAGARARRDLGREYDKFGRQINTGAIEFANEGKRQVESDRAALKGTATASGGFGDAAVAAVNRANILKSPKSFEPLESNLFDAFAADVANAAIAQRGGSASAQSFRRPLTFSKPLASTGSGVVVS